MYSTPVIFGGFLKKVAEFDGGQYPISAEWGSSGPLDKKYLPTVKAEWGPCEPQDQMIYRAHIHQSFLRIAYYVMLPASLKTLLHYYDCVH